MKTRTRILIFIVLAMPVIARAGISAPNSTTVLSKDGARILVLLSNSPADDQTPTVTLPDGRVVNVHSVFPKTGVYDAVSLQPVWTVNWFSVAGDVLASDDLRYVVRRNRFGLNGSWALAFYDRGKPTSYYTCRNLLTGLAYRHTLPYTSSDWHTRWYDQFSLNSAGNQVLVTTARRQTWFHGYPIDLGLQESYTFELSSGRVVEKMVRGRWVLWAYGVFLGLLALMLCLGPRWILRRIRTERDKRRRGFPVLGSHDFIVIRRLRPDSWR